jgi:hypothetical protein
VAEKEMQSVGHCHAHRPEHPGRRLSLESSGAPALEIPSAAFLFR